jgi:hypothetical protein
VRAQEDGDVVQVGAHVRVHGGGAAEVRQRADCLAVKGVSLLASCLTAVGERRTDCGTSGWRVLMLPCVGEARSWTVDGGVWDMARSPSRYGRGSFGRCVCEMNVWSFFAC